MPYASGTVVSVERSRAELERLLTKYGASQFAAAWEVRDGAKVTAVAFTLGGRSVRIELPLPDPNDPAFTRTPVRQDRRSAVESQQAYQAEERRRWRSLVAVVKAKLVAVSDGVTTLEREFLADVVLPDGQTVGQWVQPQLARLGAGQMPALLPGDR